MDRLFRMSRIRRVLIKMGEHFAYIQVDVQWEDGEEVVGAQVFHDVGLFLRGKRRADVGVCEVRFQIRQDGLQMREQQQIGIMVGKGEGRTHLFFSLSTLDEMILDDLFFGVRDVHYGEHRRQFAAMMGIVVRRLDNHFP